MLSFSVIKDPDETKDYGINWTEQLTPPEKIVASVWSIVSGGSALTINSSPFGDYGTVVWLSGGTKGVTYQLRNRITTDNVPARVLDMTVKLVCGDK